MEATRRDPAEEGAAAARRDAQAARVAEEIGEDLGACNCTPRCVYAPGEINDDHCEHGKHVDDHHPCFECATALAEFQADQMREGY
jgi:hypothetical protein